MKRLTLLFIVLFVITACTSQASEPPPAGSPTLTVMTHDSFSVREAVVNSFEEANNVEVVFLQSGDAGSMLNRAILTRNAPLADLLFGVDNTFLSRALEEDIFEPYESPLLEEIPDQYKLDASSRALPVDYGDVCINYDIAYFAE
ncbi:MAG TPA: thiamine ABC transporter substrate-binding protein, partial [Anaerolineales bacterium]|nr:thiamine ABC transporter substrate-binding protein [Anaerolineales bacterium]